MVDPEKYAYRCVWSEEDQEHVGLCTEFPSLSFLAPSAAAALKGIMKLVRETVADMEANGETVPVPLSTKQYSGKFVLRVGEEKHRQLAMAASESGLSLNQYVNQKLVQ